MVKKKSSKRDESREVAAAEEETGEEKEPEFEQRKLASQISKKSEPSKTSASASRTGHQPTASKGVETVSNTASIKHSTPTSFDDPEASTLRANTGNSVTGSRPSTSGSKQEKSKEVSGKPNAQMSLTVQNADSNSQNDAFQTANQENGWKNALRAFPGSNIFLQAPVFFPRLPIILPMPLLSKMDIFCGTPVMSTMS